MVGPTIASSRPRLQGPLIFTIMVTRDNDSLGDYVISSYGFCVISSWITTILNGAYLSHDLPQCLPSMLILWIACYHYKTADAGIEAAVVGVGKAGSSAGTGCPSFRLSVRVCLQVCMDVYLFTSPFEHHSLPSRSDEGMIRHPCHTWSAADAEPI